jgi:peptidyl-prolyl cis-trans isomerase D
MFDFVRKHTKIVMVLLFLLILPSFVLLGLDGYNKSKDQSAGWPGGRQGHHAVGLGPRAPARMDQLRNSMPNLDPKLLDSPEARYASLERLVRERVVAAAAEKFKLTTSDERLARELQQSPEIAPAPPGRQPRHGRYRQLLAPRA